MHNRRRQPPASQQGEAGEAREADIQKTACIPDHQRNPHALQHRLGPALQRVSVSCPPKSKLIISFAFITLATPEQAQASIKLLDAYKLDKSHILACNPLSDIEKYSSMSLEFSDLTIDPYTEKEHLKSWCIDERGRDQWVTMTGEEVGIYFNNKSEPAELVHSRKVHFYLLLVLKKIINFYFF